MRPVLVLLLAIWPGLVFAQEAGRRLTASAEASIAAAPDMAVVTIGVESQARTAAAALSSNSADMAAVIGLLRQSGLEDRDIQTSGLSISPVYARSSSSQQITGYVARNQVRARVRDLDRLGQLLDAAIGQGANQLFGLSFGLQEPGPWADRALAAAVTRAQEKALLMAEAAGVTLGRLLSVGESGGAVPVMPAARGMAVAMEAVPVAEGELQISAGATVVYEIND